MRLLLDDRDNQLYKIQLIGNRWWMAENFDYEPPSHAKKFWHQSEDGDCKMYTYDLAIASCPEGWRLPTLDDCYDLALAAGFSHPIDPLDLFNIFHDHPLLAELNLVSNLGFFNKHTMQGTGDLSTYWLACENNEPDEFFTFDIDNLNSEVRFVRDNDPNWMLPVRYVQDHLNL